MNGPGARAGGHGDVGQRRHGDRELRDQRARRAGGHRPAGSDALMLAEADTLARCLAPCRRAGWVATAEVSSLADLLGVDDAAALDPGRTWARRAEAELLRVPLRIDADGAPAELGLKESAL